MKERWKKLSGALPGFMDALLFPDDVLCLCCERALDEAARDQICPACLDAMGRLGRMQEERERANPIHPPAGMDYVHAAFPYEGPVRMLVHRLKYDCVRAAHIPLARAMALLPAGEEEIIVPVPTDRARYLRRGYNQAELLARQIGKTLGMRVETALARKERRRPQTGLSAAMRRINLVGCMEAGSAVNGRRVLLVDDVFTTGATAMEAARALLKAGAVSVGMLAAAASAEAVLEEKDPFQLPAGRPGRAKKLKIPDKNRSKL